MLFLDALTACFFGRFDNFTWVLERDCETLLPAGILLPEDAFKARVFALDAPRAPGVSKGVNIPFQPEPGNEHELDQREDDSSKRSRLDDQRQ